MERNMYRDALTVIYEQEQRKMAKYAENCGYDREDALDAINEKFKEFLEKNDSEWMASFLSKEPKQRISYMYRSVLNYLASLVKRREVGREKEAENYMKEELVHQSEPPEDAIVASEVSRTLQEAVSDLSEKQRSILMHLRNGFTVREIAEVEGMNETAVRTYRNRAYARLSKVEGLRLLMGVTDDEE